MVKKCEIQNADYNWDIISKYRHRRLGKLVSNCSEFVSLRVIITKGGLFSSGRSDGIICQRNQSIFFTPIPGGSVLFSFSKRIDLH